MAQPFVSVDTRKGRIRLNRCCYDILREPKYVQILVNPAKEQLGILRTERMVPEASRLKKESAKQGHSDIYCPGLIGDLVERYRWIRGRSYRLSALACLDSEMLVFSLPAAQMTDEVVRNGSREAAYEDQTKH